MSPLRPAGNTCPGAPSWPAASAVREPWAPWMPAAGPAPAHDTLLIYPLIYPCCGLLFRTQSPAAMHAMRGAGHTCHHSLRCACNRMEQMRRCCCKQGSCRSCVPVRAVLRHPAGRCMRHISASPRVALPLQLACAWHSHAFQVALLAAMIFRCYARKAAAIPMSQLMRLVAGAAGDGVSRRGARPAWPVAGGAAQLPAPEKEGGVEQTEQSCEAFTRCQADDAWPTCRDCTMDANCAKMSTNARTSDLGTAVLLQASCDLDDAFQLTSGLMRPDLPILVAMPGQCHQHSDLKFTSRAIPARRRWPQHTLLAKYNAAI